MRWFFLSLLAGLLAVPALAQADVQVTTLDLQAGTSHLVSGTVCITGHALPAEALASGDILVWAVTEPVVGVPDAPAAEVLAAPLAPVTAAVPTETALGLAYPNPLASRARIPFDLATPSAVRLTVFDALGRQVAVLADDAREAGEHEAVFDASQLSPGIYHVHLTAGDYVGTSRLTVVR